MNDLVFEVLTAAFMKISVFWDMTPCSPLKVNLSVTSIFRVEEYANKGTSSVRYLLHTGFVLGLFFDSE
jgi:hypothetical protein